MPSSPERTPIANSATGLDGPNNSSWLTPLSVATIGSECSLIVAWFSSELAHSAGTSSSFARAFAALVASTGVVISLLVAWVVRTHLLGKLRAADIAREMTRALRASEAANLAKSQFLANMSHEIRTPLTAIIGFAELLRTEGQIPTPTERLECVNTIHRAAEHLLTVINDILDLSKIEAGSMRFEAVDVSLRQTISDIECLLHSRAALKGISLRVTMQDGLPERIVADPTRVRQVLLNLIGNAIKFTSQGTVCLEVQQDATSREPELWFDVVDTGMGITADSAERLFAPFVQADTSVTRKHGGTGLGLSISRRLARLMGGDVRLVRSSPGEGSCFRFSLPLVTAGGSSEPKPHEPETRTSTTQTGEPRLSGRILLAEDGLDNQRLISHHLRRAGAEVDLAANGVVALEMLERAERDHTPYALLLTDIQMPEMDGYTLAHHVRTRGIPLPIVALTAHALPEDRDRCLAAGCNEYAAKPISKQLLLELCSRWMSTRDSRDMNRAA